jgi:UrcA family protein
MFNRKALSGSAGAVAAFAGLLLSTSASAEDYTVVGKNSAGWRPHSTVVMVPTGDLDLGTEAGEDALETRVRAAVSRVCGDALGRSAHPLDEFNCRVASIRDAHKQMDTLIERARGETTSGYPVVASAITLRIAE